jgi:hypothetical protein
MTAREFIKSKQNDVLLNDYTLQETEWFMTEFAKQKQKKGKTEFRWFLIGWLSMYLLGKILGCY